jgi:hypothetical protein
MILSTFDSNRLLNLNVIANHPSFGRRSQSDTGSSTSVRMPERSVSDHAGESSHSMVPSEVQEMVSPITSSNSHQGHRSEHTYQQRVQSSPSVLGQSVLTNSVPVSLLHTKQLPAFCLSFDDALTAFEPGISPWKHPVDWVAADSKHINSVAKAVAQLTENDDINQAGFPDQFIIYPVSCDYLTVPSTLAHATACSVS